MACGWLTDRFGLCWQIVPGNIGRVGHPKTMEAMMGMIKMDLPTRGQRARELGAISSVSRIVMFWL